MSYDHRARHYALSTREKLEALKPLLLSNVEMTSGYSITAWRVARTMAWAGNDSIPRDLINAHSEVTECIVQQVNAIAERFLINSDARIGQEIKDKLSSAILSCGTLTERLRPMVGEGWPPSPGMSTNGDVERAEQMIAQIRAEVLRCKRVSDRKTPVSRY